MRRKILSAALERKLERINLCGYIAHAEQIAEDIVTNLPPRSGYTFVTQHQANPVIRKEMQELRCSLDSYLRGRGTYHTYLESEREDPNKLSLVVFRRG